MKIEQRDDGWWVVGNDVADGPHGTNAQAWRRLDRLENEPVNKAEAITEWRLQQQMLGQ